MNSTTNNTCQDIFGMLPVSFLIVLDFNGADQTSYSYEEVNPQAFTTFESDKNQLLEQFLFSNEAEDNQQMYDYESGMDFHLFFISRSS